MHVRPALGESLTVLQLAGYILGCAGSSRFLDFPLHGSGSQDSALCQLGTAISRAKSDVAFLPPPLGLFFSGAGGTSRHTEKEISAAPITWPALPAVSGTLSTDVVTAVAPRRSRSSMGLHSFLS